MTIIKLTLGIKINKTLILITIFCLDILFCFAQRYDTIATRHFAYNDSILNYSDSLGQKQGLWVHYNLLFNQWCSPLSKGPSDTCFRQISKGHYQDNKKVNTWRYFRDEGCYRITEREEIYKSDGSITEIKNNETTVSNFNKDSSIVLCKAIVGKTDTISIKCLNKNNCIAKFKDETLETFPFSSLDNRLLGITNGLYDRKIKLINYNSR